MKRITARKAFKLAEVSFLKNHRMVDDSPGTYPHVTSFLSTISSRYPSGAIEVAVNYKVDNGHQTIEERGSIYLYGPDCLSCNGTGNVKGRFVSHKGYEVDPLGEDIIGCPKCGGWGVDHGFRYDSNLNQLSFKDQCKLYKLDPTRSISRVWVPKDFPNCKSFENKFYVESEITKVPNMELGVDEVSAYSGKADVFFFSGNKYAVGNYKDLGFRWFKLD